MLARHMLAVALIVAFFASPAHAELSGAEKAELRKITHTVDETAEAIHTLAKAIAASSTRVTRPVLAEAMESLFSAFKYSSSAHGLLLGAATEVNDSFRQQVRSLSRRQRVERAWERLDWTIRTLEEAAAVLENAEELGRGAAYRDAIRFTRDNHIPRAIWLASNVDRSFRFANPAPAEYPRIVGPHGDFDGAQQGQWHAGEYARQAGGWMLQAYRAEPIPDYDSVAFVMGASARIARALTYASARTARVTFGARDPRDPFFRTLKVLESQTLNVPPLYHLMQRALADLLEVASTRPAFRDALHNALVDMSDSWQRMDRDATWEMLVFPDCVPGPNGCGGRD